jgi:alanine-glyoxylate transaminase/serine-glyoxylate transaminase/serine-pyruvate transaminase
MSISLTHWHYAVLLGYNLWMPDHIAPLNPPTRLLCGPGPSNVHPQVLEAMQAPMLGHLDPNFHETLEQLVELLKLAYRREDGLTLALSATGTSGMEAGLASLTEPGDTVIVAVAGFFGARIVEIARRHGANVVEVAVELGQAVPNEMILEALDRHPETGLVAVVHAETSTGVRHPVEELAAAMRGSKALLMADCVTSLGGIELDAGQWGLDYCYSCSQKCLGAPPGLSPVSLSERALERIARRSAPVPYSFDFELLRKYWIDRPAVYHHTVPILQYYALYEALRLTLEEGLENRWHRHAAAGAHLQTGLRARGFDLLADPAYQLPQLTAVRVPEGIDGKAIQARLLEEQGIEVGGGLGPTAPPIWRVGLMGTNANIETADRLLEAFDTVVESRPTALTTGGM